MIKLKNLWKVALATMAVSAMLVACDTTGNDSGSKTEDDPLAKYKTTPETAKADSFTYGFKFSTEEGWAAQFINENATTATSFEKTILKIGSTVKMKTEAGTDKDPMGNTYIDDSTKIFVDSGEFVPAKLYTITYNKKTGEVKLTEAASGAVATEIKVQEADAEGNFPAGIYISGYLGGNWAASDNAGSAIKMNDTGSDIYSFTWAAPAPTITVTLKITMDIEATKDTPASNSTLYLRDVPVKTDGTSAIDGSIYGWNNPDNDETITAVTIKDVDASKGGIYDAAMTAKSNAAWALTNFVNKNEDVDLAKQFNLSGADDVLQLSIDAEKWVPYIKGQTSTYSWKNAQGKMEAPAE